MVAGNGIKVFLAPKAIPTPVISYGTVARKAGGAIVITASHNPHIWNGFKFKTQDGGSAPDEVTAQIEKNIARVQAGSQISALPLAEALKQRLVEYLDLDPVYFKQLARLVDLDSLRQSKLKSYC